MAHLRKQEAGANVSVPRLDELRHPLRRNPKNGSDLVSGTVADDGALQCDALAVGQPAEASRDLEASSDWTAGLFRSVRDDPGGRLGCGVWWLVGLVFSTPKGVDGAKTSDPSQIAVKLSPRQE